MKPFTLLKPGANVASPLLVIYYLLSVAGDMSTTYLGTPDLKYEGNWFIRHFNLKWPEIITYGSLHAIIASILFLISCRYIYNYYRSNPESNHKFFYEILHNLKLLASFFFMGYLYVNLFNSIYLVISNYLSYVYLFKVNNAFSEIATVYISFENKLLPYFFYLINTICIIAGTLLVYKKGRRFRSKSGLPQPSSITPDYIQMDAISLPGSGS